MKTNKKFNISKIKSTVVAAQLMALPLLAAANNIGFSLKPGDFKW